MNFVKYIFKWLNSNFVSLMAQSNEIAGAKEGI